MAKPVHPNRRKPAARGRRELRPVALGIREAFASLGLSRSKGYQLLQRGLLRSFCVDGRRLIAYQELLRFCEAMTKATPIGTRARQPVQRATPTQQPMPPASAAQSAEVL